MDADNCRMRMPIKRLGVALGLTAIQVFLLTGFGQHFEYTVAWLVLIQVSFLIAWHVSQDFK